MRNLYPMVRMLKPLATVVQNDDHSVIQKNRQLLTAVVELSGSTYIVQTIFSTQVLSQMAGTALSLRRLC